MPVVRPLHGSYSYGQFRQTLSFQLNGASAPTVLRDGTAVASSRKMFTVARTSAGLYTLTLDSKSRWPVRPEVTVRIEQGATPTAQVLGHYVKGSYNATAKTLQVKVLTTANVASDGDATDRVSVTIEGSLGTAGVDPA